MKPNRSSMASNVAAASKGAACCTDVNTVPNEPIWLMLPNLTSPVFP